MGWSSVYKSPVSKGQFLKAVVFSKMTIALFPSGVNSWDLGIIPYESIDQNFFKFLFRISISLLLQFLIHLLNLVQPTSNHHHYAILTATGSPSLPIKYSR